MRIWNVRLAILLVTTTRETTRVEISRSHWCTRLWYRNSQLILYKGGLSMTLNWRDYDEAPIRLEWHLYRVTWSDPSMTYATEKSMIVEDFQTTTGCRPVYKLTVFYTVVDHVLVFTHMSQFNWLVDVKWYWWRISKDQKTTSIGQLWHSLSCYFKLITEIIRVCKHYFDAESCWSKQVLYSALGAKKQ